MEVPMTITDEQRRAIVRGEPVRLEDPETHVACVVVREDVYRRLAALGTLDPTPDDPRPEDAYPAADEAFREGWEAPGMSDYDDYEAHRP